MRRPDSRISRSQRTVWKPSLLRTMLGHSSSRSCLPASSLRLRLRPTHRASSLSPARHTEWVLASISMRSRTPIPRNTTSSTRTRRPSRRTSSPPSSSQSGPREGSTPIVSIPAVCDSKLSNPGKSTYIVACRHLHEHPCEREFGSCSAGVGSVPINSISRSMTDNASRCPAP